MRKGDGGGGESEERKTGEGKKTDTQSTLSHCLPT